MALADGNGHGSSLPGDARRVNPIRRLFNWYMQRVMQLTTSNALVADQFVQVLHLLKPPTVLFDPRIAFAVLKQELTSHRQKSSASLPTNNSSSRVLTQQLDAVT